MTTEADLTAALAQVASRFPEPRNLWSEVAAALDTQSGPTRRRGYGLMLAAVVASVAIAAAGLAAVATRRDRPDAGPSPSTTAPPTATGSRDELPTFFVALGHDGALAVVDTVTLRTTAVLVRDCTDCSRLRVTPDQTRVRYQKGRSLYEIPLAGGGPQTLAEGCLVAVSPDDEQVAVADCQSGAIRMNDQSGGGAGPGWPAGPSPVIDLTWGSSTSTLLAAAGSDPVAIYRYSLERLGSEPERLGPPEQGQPAGTGWISPDVGGDGVIAVAEVCCSLPTGSYSADSTVVYLAPSDGHQLVRNKIKASLVSLDFDGTGRFLLLVGADGDLFAEWQGKRLRLGGGFRDASW